MVLEEPRIETFEMAYDSGTIRRLDHLMALSLVFCFRPTG